MGQTHTPGPWVVDGGLIIGCQDPDNAQTIAAFEDYCGPSPQDAALIAAAPDMLAALISIFEHGREFSGIEDSETMMVRITEKARAAIAKAEGA